MTELQFSALVVLLVGILVAVVLLYRRESANNPGADIVRSVNQSAEQLNQQFQKANADMAARVEQVRGDLRTDLTDRIQSGLQQLRETVDRQLSTGRDEQARRLAEGVATLEKKFEALKSDTGEKLDSMSQKQSVSLRESREELSQSFGKLSEGNEKKLTEVREAVEKKLDQIQKDNSAKLEEMRKTVDEKLESTLEKRLADSFKQVSERLEQVHKGLGEMQALAIGVGDLKKVLTNVKSRGTWGEVQLGNLLAQLLTPEQYATNVATIPGSSERVEFAVKLPGKENQNDEVVWLPIDAKFPKEDYERLVDAAEKSDPILVEEAAKQLEIRIKAEAKTIRDKYIGPPHTTDFAVLFLPTEGLYAEVIRRPGLVDFLQRDCRVTVAGPTVLAALLNSLQMGFRTLAIEKRSSEVWKVLGAVKTEFDKFGTIFDKVKKKLQEASNVVEDASRKTRTIGRKLRDVDQLTATETDRLLGTGDERDPDETNSDA